MASVQDLIALHEAQYGRPAIKNTLADTVIGIMGDRQAAQAEQQKAMRDQQMAVDLLSKKYELEKQQEVEKQNRVAQEADRQFNIYKQFQGMDDRTVSGDTKRVIEGGKAKELERKARVIGRQKVTSKYDIVDGKASVTIEDKSPIEILQEEVAYGFYNTPQEIVKRGMELGADANKLEALATTAAIPGVMSDAQPMAVPKGYEVASYKPNKFGIMEPTGYDKPKPQTESQAKAALFAQRTSDAEQVFTQLEDYIGNLGFGEKVEEALPNFANFMKSSDMQQYEQAQRNFYNAILRRESGAVISPSEFKEAKMQYFPQAGDKAAVIAQKKRNREVAIGALAKEGGVDLAQQQKQPPANDPLGLR